MAQDDVAFGDSPSMLYTGNSSRMFHNEKIADNNRKKREMEAKRAAMPKGVRGLVADLEGILHAAKIENDSFSSYMITMRKQSEAGKPISQEDLIAELRGREMNLQLIMRIQQCLDKYRLPTPS